MCISPPLCYKTRLLHQLSSHKPLLTPGGSWEEASVWCPLVSSCMTAPGGSRKLGTCWWKPPLRPPRLNIRENGSSRSPPWWQPRRNLPVHTDRKSPQVCSHVCEGSQRLIAASCLPGWTAATSWSRRRGERLNLAITMLLQSTIATDQRESAPSMRSANGGKCSGFQVFSEPCDPDIPAGAVG